MKNVEDRVIELERTVATLKKDVAQLSTGLAQVLSALIHDLTPSPTYLSMGEILANDQIHRPSTPTPP